MRLSTRPHLQKSAFTLLEVILALAILAGSVAVLGEVMSIASRHSNAAQTNTRAQILARSIMNELVVGMTEPTEQTRQALDVDDTAPWVFSVTFGNTNMAGLTAVEVLVEQDLEPQFFPTKYRLIRWLPTSSNSEEDEADESESEGEDA